MIAIFLATLKTFRSLILYVSLLIELSNALLSHLLFYFVLGRWKESAEFT